MQSQKQDATTQLLCRSTWNYSRIFSWVFSYWPNLTALYMCYNIYIFSSIVLQLNEQGIFSVYNRRSSCSRTPDLTGLYGTTVRHLRFHINDVAKINKPSSRATIIIKAAVVWRCFRHVLHTDTNQTRLHFCFYIFLSHPMFWVKRKY